jgi:hypothetical protein
MATHDSPGVAESNGTAPAARTPATASPWPSVALSACPGGDASRARPMLAFMRARAGGSAADGNRLAL